MWTEQGTVWHSVCGLDTKECVTVYVDPTGKCMVLYMCTEEGTVWYSVCGLNKGNCVVHCMWTE